MSNNFILEAYAHISSSLSIEQSLARAVDFLKKEIPADGAFIDIHLESLHQIRFLAMVEPGKASRLNQAIALTPDMEQSLKRPDRPKIMCINDIAQDPVTEHVAKAVKANVRSFIILRLELDKRHLGVVAFYSNRYGAFNQHHAQLLAELHDPFALVTANALNPILSAENLSLRKLNEQLQSKLTQTFQTPLEKLLQRTPSLKPIAEKIIRVAPYDTTILLTGETGCGKEVIANIIHQTSVRNNKPFIKVNCGAIPETLLDNELFGHEKGAFTDAKHMHVGYFEQADGGTLFLDEIAELPLSAQVRLLRVLQHKTITRIGGRLSITLDVRIIAATHKSLENLVKNNQFREDLWYRLNVFPIEIPPLRERHADILPLTEYLINKLQSKYNLPYLPALSKNSLEQAYSYAWPGNVRELENLLERTVLQSQGKTIHFLLPHKNTPTTHCTKEPLHFQALPQHMELNVSSIKPLDTMMRDYLVNVLQMCNGKISGENGAAQRLGLHPNTLRSRMQKLGILPKKKSSLLS